MNFLKNQDWPYLGTLFLIVFIAGLAATSVNNKLKAAKDKRAMNAATTDAA